jgi:hypothetical protein
VGSIPTPSARTHGGVGHGWQAHRTVDPAPRDTGGSIPPAATGRRTRRGRGPVANRGARGDLAWGAGPPPSVRGALPLPFDGPVTRRRVPPLTGIWGLGAAVAQLPVEEKVTGSIPVGPANTPPERSGRARRQSARGRQADRGRLRAGESPGYAAVAHVGRARPCQGRGRGIVALQPLAGSGTCPGEHRVPLPRDGSSDGRATGFHPVGHRFDPGSSL